MKLPSVIAACAYVLLGFAIPVAAPVFPHSAAEARRTCSGEYYRNVNGRCVHRPVQAAHAPVGATAKCRDGTYSFSQHRRGTCSHHGGVAEWL